MKKRLVAELPDEIMGELDKIVERSGKNRTQVVTGMIEHWAAVMADHERRGFVVVPLAGRSFASAMVADRAGMFDETTPAADGHTTPPEV